MTDTAVRFERVSKVYPGTGGGDLWALHDVNLEIPAGRSVAVQGRSGSGKSTLLHLAAGIDEPTSGKVVVLGRDLAGLTDRERSLHRRDRVGLVFQFFHLLPHLRVLDNVLLPAWIAGDGAAETASRARALLHRVGLANRASDPVQGLSGGEQQRVALCRALLRRPPLLLADEPTGALDDEGSRAVMELLLGLVAEEGATLVFVTHSRELAAMADRRFTLRSGRLEVP